MKRQRLRALLVAALASASAPADALDPRLLPENPRYERPARCTDVTVVEPEPRPFTHPLDGRISPAPADAPMSQGDSAICLAYATADMISQRVGVTVSALDVATKYYFSDPSLLARIRTPALRRHLRDNPDLADTIADSRNDTDVSRDRNPARIPYFDKLEDGQEDIAALLYNIGGLCEDRDLPSFDGYGQQQKVLQGLRWRARVVRPLQCYRALGATVDKLRSRDSDSFNAGWLTHIERRCKRKPLPVPLLPVSAAIADNQADLMERQRNGTPPARAETERLLAMIDYALDHGRVPTVGYSWYVLEERDPKDADFSADHSSPVIARRHVRGHCQYRIQDNTGEYCARMRPGIRERCELGRVWLNEEELRASLYSVIYLR